MADPTAPGPTPGDTSRSLAFIAGVTSGFCLLTALHALQTTLGIENRLAVACVDFLIAVAIFVIFTLLRNGHPGDYTMINAMYGFESGARGIDPVAVDGSIAVTVLILLIALAYARARGGLRMACALAGPLLVLGYRS